jgi:hypothetical protein
MILKRVENGTLIESKRVGQQPRDKEPTHAKEA